MFKNSIRLLRNPIIKRNYFKINEGIINVQINEISTKGMIWKHTNIRCSLDPYLIIYGQGQLSLNDIPHQIDLSLSKYELDKDYFIKKFGKNIIIKI